MSKKKPPRLIVPPVQALKSLQEYHKAVVVMTMALEALLPQLPESLLKDSIKSQLEMIKYFHNPVEP